MYIKIFLLYGTLLGQQRNNKLICYDYDIDVGIFSPDFTLIKTALERDIDKNIFSLNSIDMFLSKKIEIIHKETNLSLDIFSYQKTKSGSIQRNINYLSHLYFNYVLNQCNKRNIPKNWILPLQPVTFLGKKTYIPNNPELLLKCEYGENYLIPDHKCNVDCSKCTQIE